MVPSTKCKTLQHAGPDAATIGTGYYTTGLGFREIGGPQSRPHMLQSLL